MNKNIPCGTCIVSVGDPIGVVVSITILAYTGADNVSISIFIPPQPQPCETIKVDDKNIPWGTFEVR